ncbi:MAG: hypothetical protein V3T30_08715, partial [Thermodesulfobacteriota bacterium]
MDKMDKKKLEEMLKALDVPAPDEARKEAILKASTAEFEEARKKIVEESKGIKAVTRQRSKGQGKSKSKNFFKGGFQMTRPVYATLGTMVVAVLLIYGFIYNPGVYEQKNLIKETPLFSKTTTPPVKATPAQIVTPVKATPVKVLTDGPAIKANLASAGDADKKLQFRDQSVVVSGNKPDDSRQVASVEEAEEVGAVVINESRGKVSMVDRLASTVMPRLAKKKARRSDADAYSKRESVAGLAVKKSPTLSRPAAPMVHHYTFTDSEIAIQPEYSGRDRFERLK